MPPPTSEPDPSKPDLSATGVLRAQPVDTRFETDFAQLAACFSAKSGGGLSPEISTDLALEIVLNEVVEQACLTTGATGAAIALQREGEMICRASSGATSPALGSRLDVATGLAGECVRTRRTQRSDDVLADLRVDPETSQRLGLRSVMVMPLLSGNELVGLFELFSSLPNAFGERDKNTLDALALRILSNLERAAAPLTPQNEPLPLPEIQEIIPEMPESLLPQSVAENVPDRVPEHVSELVAERVPGRYERSSPQREFDSVTWALRVAVLVCAVMLGLLLGRHMGTRRSIAHRRPVAIPVADGGTSSAPGPASDAATPARAEGDTTQAPPPTPAKRNQKSAPPGSLLVFENGKEIFRMPPQRNEGALTAQKQSESSPPRVAGGVQRASASEPEQSSQAGKVDELSPAAAAGSLIHRVEPEYPEEARQQKIQGAAVLEVQVGPDGAVQDVKVISGPPQLAKASIDAVKQWRFKPRLVDGQPVPMQTRITLNFRLPQ